MTYPEAIPIIKRKDIEEFDEKLKDFSLTEDQVRKYAHAKKRFSKIQSIKGE